MRLIWLRFACLPFVCLPFIAACTDTTELSEVRPALSFADRTAACAASPWLLQFSR